MMARVLAHVARASGPRNLTGACMLAAVVLWPAIAVGVGAWQAAQPARPRSYDGLLALHGIPAVLGPLAQRTLADPWDRDSSAAITLGSLALSAAVVVLLASAFTALSEEDLGGLAAERRTALDALGAAALAAIGISLLGRPPRSDPDWHAGPPTPAGDHVFGELLPRWNDGRSGAEATLVGGAQGLDAGLGAALSALITETARGGLLERRWYRLIDRVNEASRRAELPYYVDPTGVISAGGDTRWYRLDVYRIERVSRFASSTGRTLTTLHVRALAPGRPRPAALGLSRDVQPYAVVAVDEIHAYQADLERLAAQAPPRCGEGLAESAAAEEALRACGEALAGSIARGELGPALLAATERHEIQHRIDGAAPRRSAWLGSRLAWYEPAARARIERELSAYLAQMTAPGQAPRLTLMRLLRMALLVRRGVEHDVARLAFEALGGAGPDTYVTLAGRDDEALRRDAEGAYRAVFGRDLPHVTPE
jgi:hypothetical protein